MTKKKAPLYPKKKTLFQTFDKTPQEYFTYEDKNKIKNKNGQDTFIVIQNNVSNHWNQSVGSQQASSRQGSV